VEQSTSTSGYTDAVIANLGRAPSIRYPTKAGVRTGPVPAPRTRWAVGAARAIDTVLHGVDVYVQSDLEPNDLGRLLDTVAGPEFRLQFISTRGTLVYPETGGKMDNVGWWRCRFIAAEDGTPLDDAAIGHLLGRVAARVTWVQVQKLRLYGGEEGFTRAQGQ
jgi:isocitrate dehydrogenase